MEALQAAIALSEAVSVDSDTSKIMEAAADRAGGQRRRKQRAPTRSAFSSDTPSDVQQAALKQQQQHGQQQQTSIQPNHSSGESPVLNNHAGLEVPVSRMQHSSSRSSKSSPAQRQGPCGHCKTPYSPQWRKGPRNKPVLCNACGIRYLRNRHLGRAVPQKKRTTSVSGLKAGATTDSAAEASVDTLTDSNDMHMPSKKRRMKQAELADEDTSVYSYDSSAQETVGSVGDLQHYLEQHRQQEHAYSSDIHPAAAMADTAAGAVRTNSDVTEAMPAVSTGQEAGAHDDTGASVPSTQEAAHGAQAFGTSVAMPGNMQPLLLPMNSITSAGNIYNGYNMALALQLYQQQQQQQLLYTQQQLLLTQGSSGSASLQTANSVAHSSLSAASLLQGDDSQPGSPALASSNTAGRAAAAPALLYTQSLQMQQLQGYLRQQQQQAQQAQLLHAAGMLHGPSPLSVMSSANRGGLRLGSTAGLSSLLQGPASTSAVPATKTRLEIEPLVCGDKLLPLDPAAALGQTAAVSAALATAAAATAGVAALSRPCP